MKKSQVNAILINQAKKRQMIFALLSLIVLCFIFSCCFFLTYLNRNQNHYVKYDESSYINYKVHLKENEFFNSDYLTENNQYIASLIDHISADFKYNLALEENNVEYKYAYRIEAEVKVTQTSTGNTLYNTKQELKSTTKKTTTEDVTIREDVNIDYNYYNELIKRFVNIYSLEDTTSTLNINMYVDVASTHEKFEDKETKDSVITLSIPLTAKTMAIDLSNNLVNSEDNLLQYKPTTSRGIMYLVLASLLAITAVVLIIYTIQYEIKTRTAENIYEKELKKILNNYSSYIQTLNSDFDFTDYQPLRIDTFSDMLEIRDTIHQPILMREKHDRSGAYFLIPSSTKILYVYRLNVRDIEKELQKS